MLLFYVLLYTYKAFIRLAKVDLSAGNSVYIHPSNWLHICITLLIY